MPMMDLSVALTNPYTLDSFDVHHRQQQINDFGETSVCVSKYACAKGLVYPQGQNEFKRRPEAQINEKSIEIITKFPLRGESQCRGTNFQPDYVKWRGNFFIVKNVEDWSNYAAGFVLAVAESIDMIDNPPTPEQSN